MILNAVLDNNRYLFIINNSTKAVKVDSKGATSLERHHCSALALPMGFLRVRTLAQFRRFLAGVLTSLYGTHPNEYCRGFARLDACLVSTVHQVLFSHSGQIEGLEMKKGIFAAFFASACMLLSVNAFAEQTCTKEKPCVMRIGTVAPDNTPWAQIAQDMKERAERESEGRLKVIPRVGQSNESSLVRQCRDGSIEAVGASTAAMASQVPALSVFEIPFLFSSEKQADRAIDHSIKHISKAMAKKGFTLYIMTENGFQDWATTSNKEIRTPDDFRGIQMRAQESWIHEAMYKALNANYTTIPTAEVQTALSTGRIQGYAQTPLFAQAAGWDKPTKTWTLSHHIYQPAVVAINKKWFDSLPKDLQDIIMAERKETTISGRRMIRQVNPLLIKNLEKSGVKLIKLSDEEKEAFRKATEGIKAEFRKRVPDGIPLLDSIEKYL